MKQKIDMILELIPIEFAGMFREETLAKARRNWTKDGLQILKVLWHRYYTTQAHRYICAALISIKEKDLIWKSFVKLLKEAE